MDGLIKFYYCQLDIVHVLFCFSPDQIKTGEQTNVLREIKNLKINLVTGQSTMITSESYLLCPITNFRLKALQLQKASE